MSLTQFSSHRGAFFKRSFLIFAALILLFSFAGSAGAVDNWDDLRVAVNAAPIGTPIIIEITADFDTAGSTNADNITIPAGRDITITSDLTASGAPFTITQLTDNQRHFLVNNGQLRLSDITLAGAPVGEMPPVDVWRGGLWVFGPNGRLYLYDGGVLTRIRSSSADAGAVVVRSGAVFHMYGGVIEHNRAMANGYVGGVSIHNGAFFYMHDGSIRNNDFGGVRLMTNAPHSNTFTMTGGAIYDNHAFTAYRGNTNTGGAGVHVGGHNTFIMSGDAQIHSNTALSTNPDNRNRNAGGVGLGPDSYFYMSGDARIFNNKVTGFGGGVFLLSGGTFIMDGGTIEDNIAGDGSGVFLSSDSTFIMDDGEISGNVAAQAGGGVFLSSDSTFIMDDGEISGNTANNGGGIAVAAANRGDPALFSLSASTIFHSNVALNGISDYGLEDGLTNYPNIRWQGYLTGINSASGTHLINNFDIINPITVSGGGGGRGTGYATIVDNATVTNGAAAANGAAVTNGAGTGGESGYLGTGNNEEQHAGYAYELPAESVLAIVLLFVVGIAVFAYRRVEETKEEGK